MKTWIKMTDRAPTETDLPVWGEVARGVMPVYLYQSVDWQTLCSVVDRGVLLRWRPAKDDIPAPPREETQADKDNAFLDAWDAKHPTGSRYDLAHAALAWERERMAEMLPTRPTHEFTHAELVTIIEAIRVLCEGGAK